MEQINWSRRTFFLILVLIGLSFIYYGLHLRNTNLDEYNQEKVDNCKYGVPSSLTNGTEVCLVNDGTYYYIPEPENYMFNGLIHFLVGFGILVFTYIWIEFDFKCEVK